MIENENIKTTSSLNDAFDLILKIFNEERTYYESTINSLKGKVSELEESLLQVKKENMSYQSRISKLKGKLRSISKTVSKLEDSDYETKLNSNNKRDSEKTEISSNNTSNYNTIKYKNTDTINSFRRKSKLLTDINRPSNIYNTNTHTNTINTNLSNQQFYIKMNTIDNCRLNNNGEDIYRHFNKKIHKKTLSTKIKNSILNTNHQTQIRKRNDENNLLKSHNYNDEDVSLYLMNDLKENTDFQNRISLPVERENKSNENKKKFQTREKYNKIEQKIKGLKSALSIYNKNENLNATEGFPNSVNIQNTFSKSTPYII